MRKIVLTAMLAMSMVALAQKVTPVEIQIADVKLDSLRTLYMNEPTMWRASLEVVGQQLSKNADELKAARNVYKEEQKHAGEMDKSIKEATKMAAALKKLYSKEEGELKDMQKTVEGQQRTLNKQRELNQETRDTYLAFLEKQQKELGYALREVAERQRGIADIETSIQNLQTQLQSYIQQVQQKNIELSQLEAQLKQKQEALKVDQKTAKTMK
jgi:chromosome segregation ATPase